MAGTTDANLGRRSPRRRRRRETRRASASWWHWNIGATQRSSARFVTMSAVQSRRRPFLLLLRLLLLFILLPLLVLFRPLLVFLFVWRRFAPFCAVRLRLASQFGSDQRRAVDADGDVPVRRTSHRRLAHSPQLRKRLARNRVRRKKKPEHHPLTRNVSAVGAEMAWSICLLAASGAAVARWSSSLERKGSLFPRN